MLARRGNCYLMVTRASVERSRRIRHQATLRHCDKERGTRVRRDEGVGAHLMALPSTVYRLPTASQAAPSSLPLAHSCFQVISRPFRNPF